MSSREGLLSGERMSARAGLLNVLGLVLACLAYGAISMSQDDGPPWEAVDWLHWWAGALGGATVLFVISSLLPFIWFAIGWFRGWNAWGGYVLWWILSLGWMGLTYQGRTLETNYAPTEATLQSTVETPFAPDGCDFQVTFPGPPEVQSSQAPKVRYDQAQLIHRRNGLLAECHVYESDILPFGLDDAERHFQTYAELLGLRFVDVSTKQHANGMPIYLGRATKTSTSDSETTYRIGIVAGERSTMTVTVAGPTAEFPTAAMEIFWASLRPR